MDFRLTPFYCGLNLPQIYYLTLNFNTLINIFFCSIISLTTNDETQNFYKRGSRGKGVEIELLLK